MNELRTIDELTRDELIELKRAHLCATQRQISLFDLIKDTIGDLSSSQGSYERLERQIQNDDFALRNLAFQAMKANAKAPVDIVMMMEAA